MRADPAKDVGSDLNGVEHVARDLPQGLAEEVCHILIDHTGGSRYFEHAIHVYIHGRGRRALVDAVDNVMCMVIYGMCMVGDSVGMVCDGDGVGVACNRHIMGMRAHGVRMPADKMAVLRDGHCVVMAWTIVGVSAHHMAMGRKPMRMAWAIMGVRAHDMGVCRKRVRMARSCVRMARACVGVAWAIMGVRPDGMRVARKRVRMAWTCVSMTV